MTNVFTIILKLVYILIIIILEDQRNWTITPIYLNKFGYSSISGHFPLQMWSMLRPRGAGGRETPGSGEQSGMVYRFKVTPQRGKDYRALPKVETKEAGVLLSSSFQNN